MSGSCRITKILDVIRFCGTGSHIKILSCLSPIDLEQNLISQSIIVCPRVRKMSPGFMRVSFIKE
jgi:hypothetical protein